MRIHVGATLLPGALDYPGAERRSGLKPSYPRELLTRGAIAARDRRMPRRPQSLGSVLSVR